MAVLLYTGAMCVIVILTVRLTIKHVIFWVMFQFVEFALSLENFSDDIESCFLQHPVTFNNLRASFCHSFQL